MGTEIPVKEEGGKNSRGWDRGEIDGNKSGEMDMGNRRWSSL